MIPPAIHVYHLKRFVKERGRILPFARGNQEGFSLEIGGCPLLFSNQAWTRILIGIVFEWISM
jgi:hypothetical protein